MPTATHTPHPTATATRIIEPTVKPLATATRVIEPTAIPLPTATLAAISPRGQVDNGSSDPRFGVDEAYMDPSLANALGVRWSRIPFSWNNIQPHGPSDWNRFALSSQGTDSVVNGEIARGRSVVGLLLGTPGWAAYNPAWGTASVPKNIDKPWNSPDNYWGAFCERIAKEFAGRIDDWIIWNEVNIPGGGWLQWHATSKATSAQEYARLLEVAYRAIHAANPKARVIIYGDPYWYDHGTFLGHLFYLLSAAGSPAAHNTRLLAKAAPATATNGFFDVANLHLYSNPADFFGIVNKLRSQLKAHGWGNKEIWVSETNAEPYDDPVAPAPHTNFRVSMQGQASFMVDAFASYLAAGVTRLEVYRMIDRPSDHDTWGLVNKDGQQRPVTTTYRFLVGLFKGVTGGQYTPGTLLGGKSGVIKVVLYKPARRITVLWNQDGHPDGSDATVRYKLQAHASQATLFDKYGHSTTLTPSNGAYTLTLPGGTDFTNPYDPRIPTVGGDPAIVVETVS